MPVIEVEHLTKLYQTTRAVDDVSFSVDKGEILGFLGPNGAGKTTTMRILTCYLSASSGTAKVAGFDVFEDSREVRRRIGYMPEHPPLYKDMRVRQYLEFVAKIKGIDPRDRVHSVARAMERTSVTHVADTIVNKLSRGYQQRVGLAQALVHDPEVLILDEPTIGLDPKQIIEVRELIKDLAGDHTIVLSTHILPEASMICQRVVIINKGVIVAEDRPENLTQKLKSSERVYVDVEGKGDDVAATIRELPRVTRVQVESALEGRASLLVESEVDADVRSDLARLIVGRSYGLLEMRPVAMSLEEIFLQLTTTEEEETA
jgi:ABC-2 type transport system ATP-binding protein